MYSYSFLCYTNYSISFALVAIEASNESSPYYMTIYYIDANVVKILLFLSHDSVRSCAISIYSYQLVSHRCNIFSIVCH